MPISLAAFGTKLTQAAWRNKPSWAIYGTDDKGFDQRMLADMTKRIGADLTTIAASHAIYVSQPGAVADVIDRAARGIRS